MEEGNFLLHDNKYFLYVWIGNDAQKSLNILENTFINIIYTIF